MPTFRLKNGIGPTHRYRDASDFDLTTLTLTGGEFTREGGAGYDPDEDFHTIELFFDNAKDYDIQEGPDAGGTTLLDGGRMFTTGIISRIDYKNDLGEVVASVTGLSISLSWFSAYMKDRGGNTSDLWDVFDAAFSGELKVIGARDPNDDGLENGNDFQEFITGSGKDTLVGGPGFNWIQDRGGADNYKIAGLGTGGIDYSHSFWNPHLAKRGILVNLSAPKNKDFVIGYDGKKDLVKKIFEFVGTAKDDKFIGDSTGNLFTGLQGRDDFDGKGGFDVLDYSLDKQFGAWDGIVVDTVNKLVRDGSGGIDSFKNVEGFLGTDQDDVFNIKMGGTKPNLFRGRDGDDVFNVNGGGIHLYQGDDGDDTYNFGGDTFRAKIDDFVIGEDFIFVDSFDSIDAVGVDGPGGYLIGFMGSSAGIEFSNLTKADVDGAGGIGALMGFYDPVTDPIELAVVVDNGAPKSAGPYKPQVQWFDGNQGFYRYKNMDRAEITSLDENGMVMEFTTAFSDNKDAYDPTQDWFRAEFTFKNAVWHQYETAPGDLDFRNDWFEDGTFSGGHITGVNFWNQDGYKIMEVTGTKVDLTWLSGFYTQVPDLNELPNAMIGPFGATYLGANYGGGPDSDWSGDDITTGFGNDKVFGYKGDDFISGHGGKDFYNGHSGNDTLSYESEQWLKGIAYRGIEARLDKDYVIGFDGKKDTVKNIENVRGTSYRDKFLGDGKDNGFFGLGGNDRIDGKGGIDEASYRRDADRGGTDGIIVDMSMGTAKNLWKGTVRDGFGKTDTLFRIERVEGTDSNDVYTDFSRNDYFRAREGDDIINFSRGKDFANLGNDGDADLLIFNGNSWGDDGAWGFDDGTDLIQITNLTEVAFDGGAVTVSDAGDDALIEWNGNSLTLYDFDDSDVSKIDFVFV